MKHPRCSRCGGIVLLKDHAAEFLYCLDCGWEDYGGPVRSIEVRPVQLDMMEFLVASAAGRVGHPATTLVPSGRVRSSGHTSSPTHWGPPSGALAVNRKAAGALLHHTPLDPRAQHTVRLCVDQVVPATSTLPLAPRQSLSGGEVAATFEPSDFGLNTVSTAKLASVEGDRAAAFYFAVRIEDQADTERVVVVVNGSGALVLRGGSLYAVRVEAQDAGSGSRGLLDLSVFVDRVVSPQGDGRCPLGVKP